MWPQDKFNRLSNEERRWLRNLHTQYLEKLGFSQSQRSKIDDSPSACPPLRPLFTINNPVLSGVSVLECDIAVTGLTYQKWNQMMSSTPSPQQPSDTTPPIYPTPSPGTLLSLTPLEKKWLSLNFSNEDLIDFGFTASQISDIKSCISIVSTSRKPSNFNPPFNLPITIETIAPSAPTPTQGANTCSELSLKYLDCFGVKGDKVVYIVEFKNDGNGEVIVQYRTINNGEVSVLENDVFDSSFDMSLPKLGLINHDNYVVLVQRRHKKSSPSKYRKALRADTLIVDLPSYKEIKLLNQTGKLINNIHEGSDIILRKFAEDLFFPKMLTYKEALESVLSFSRLSAAFSSNMAIKLDASLNKIVIIKNQWTIGHLNKKSKRFDMIINTFNNQLIELDIPFKEAKL